MSQENIPPAGQRAQFFSADLERTRRMQALLDRERQLAQKVRDAAEAYKKQSGYNVGAGSGK